MDMKLAGEIVVVEVNGIMGIPIQKMSKGIILFQPTNGVGGAFVYVPLSDKERGVFVGDFIDCIEQEKPDYRKNWTG